MTTGSDAAGANVPRETPALKRFVRWRADPAVTGGVLEHSDGETWERVPVELGEMAAKIIGANPPGIAMWTSTGEVVEVPKIVARDEASGPLTHIGVEVAAIMETLKASESWPKCPECGAQYPRLIEVEIERDEHEGPERVAVCVECDARIRAEKRLAAEADAYMRDLDRLAIAYLRRGGMSPRELEATIEKIPAAVQRAIGAEADTLISGMVPRAGFGLRGSAGIGKTCAIAALMQRMVTTRLGAMIPAGGRKAFAPWFQWVAWPELANGLRVRSTHEGGIEEAERIMQKLADAEALVLDDLGMERSKPEDWVASLLDLLIDARYKARRPTWYTTHLTREELVERYGARMFSRLVGDNPTFEIARAADQRVAR